MTIDTRDKLISSLGNNNSRMILDKASLANQAPGVYCSMWRAPGQPGQGLSPQPQLPATMLRWAQ